MTLFRVCACLVVVAGPGGSLEAQVRPRPTIPFVTAMIGIGGGSGSGFVQRNTIDLDVSGGVLFHNRRKYSLIGGAFAGLTYKTQSNPLVCPPSVHPSACGKMTPTVEYSGVMFGVESSPLEGATSAGFAMGPALVQTSRILDKDDSGVEANRTGGLQIRIDGTRRLQPTTRLIFSLRTMYLPNFQGRNLSLSTFSIGLRFQRFQPFN